MFQDKSRVLNRSFVEALQQHPSVIHSSSSPLHLNNSAVWKPNHCWQVFTTPSYQQVNCFYSAAWVTYTVGKRKRYFYMFLFSKDRYFFLSRFTTYFSVLLNLGSIPVQPLLSSDIVTNHKGFIHRPAHLFPSFQSPCILNILTQLPQIALLFHFIVTVTCAAWFSRCWI